MNPENANWLTQKSNSVACGPIAILNAKIWLGEKVKLSSVEKLSKELGVSHQKCGVSGTDLNSWISKKSNFGVQRIVQPKLREASAIIRSGNGFILGS